MEEAWRDIPGYEGRYQVSNLGRVKSLPRVRRGHGGGYIRVPERILRGSPDESGHVAINLRDGFNTRHVEIHRLVMQAFVGPCPAGMEVCHNDSNPANNCLENLRYDTHMNNMIDVAYVGNRGRQKLSVEDVKVIRARLDSGDTGVRIAKDYGVTPAAISAIKTGKNFGWLSDERRKRA